MKMFFLLSLLLCHIYVYGKDHPYPKINLNGSWEINSSAVVKEEGNIISTLNYTPKNWYPAKVPTTVLHALTKAGVYPDFRFGLNSYLIPDACEKYNKEQNLSQYSHLPNKQNPWTEGWWFRKTFNIDKSVNDKHVWLHFNSINYRAEIWVNGQLVAGRDSVMSPYHRYTFDISKYVKTGSNCLSVKVWIIDHIGPPGPPLKPLIGNRFEDHSSDALMDYTVLGGGYDCFPTVPDRFMGILQEVWIDFSGPVVITDPFVVTKLPLPLTNNATLKISTTLTNYSNKPITGVLKGIISNAGINLENKITLKPNETREVAFDSAIMKNPKLWWPVGFGKQDQYTLNLKFVIENEVSSIQDVNFGIRQITCEMHEYKGHHGRRILINGQKIYTRGGYIQPEAMWDWDKERIDAEIRYYAHANLNFIYFEDVANPPSFLMEACDRYGVMIGNCFYGCSTFQPTTNDLSSPKFPGNIPHVISCTRDIIRRYRNHPSLIMYMPLNEGDTRQDLYEPWRASVIELDGTRFFIPSGFFPDIKYEEWPQFYKDFRHVNDYYLWFLKDLPVGMTDCGATYTWVEPSEYYHYVRDNPGWMFMMEAGMASVPPMSSLTKFLPNIDKPSEGALFPLNDEWAHHGANQYYKPYDDAVRRIFGEPATVADYVWNGHLISGESNRAMFEAVNHRLWDITSGFTQWKINSGWPDVQWQIFDWFLKPMASYYFIKRSTEPIHIQLGLIEPTVTLVNQTTELKKDLTARVKVFDMALNTLYEHKENTEIAANSYRDIFQIPDLTNLPEVYFVNVELTDAKSQLISSNIYWFPSKKGGSMKALHALPSVKVICTNTIETMGDKVFIHAKIKNTTNQLAFMLQTAAVKEKGGNEILPVFWSDNYISLMPGEQRILTAEVNKKLVDIKNIHVEIGGWNINTDYTCDSLIAPTTVKANTLFTVSSKISKTFLDGSRVELMVDDKMMRSAYCLARSEKRADAEFKIQLPAGKHTIAIKDKVTNVIVLE